MNSRVVGPIAGRDAALVIDSRSASRQALAFMLRGLGFKTISAVSRLDEAKRCLETRPYEVLVCDYHFEGQGQTGSEWLAGLRRDGLLPLATVVIMVTSESKYPMVADAAETAIDWYLIKPHTAGDLAKRVVSARLRKRLLRPIHDAIAEGDFEGAGRDCMRRVKAREKHWVHAARLGAEVQLRLGKPQQAAELYHAVVEVRALPWARLGVARAQIADKDLPQAKATLESLLADHSSYVDAYDVMGSLHIEQGHFDKALDTYRLAAELTPWSLSRLHKQGMLAFMVGQTGEAARVLSRVVAQGLGTKAFDPQTWMLLALVQVEQNDLDGVKRCREELAAALRRDGETPRVRRMQLLAAALVQAIGAQPAHAVPLLQQMASAWPEPDFDFEAAVNLVAAVSAVISVRSVGVTLAEATEWVRLVARRFATSKSSSDTLAAAARRQPMLADAVRRGYAEVSAMTEQAMSHALNGDRERTVRELVGFAGETGNSRILDTATRTLQRYRNAIKDAASLAALSRQVEELALRYGASR